MTLAAGGFIAQQRNAVLVGGTGTGKDPILPSLSPAVASDQTLVGDSITSSTLVNRA